MTPAVIPESSAGKNADGEGYVGSQADEQRIFYKEILNQFQGFKGVMI